MVREIARTYAGLVTTPPQAGDPVSWRPSGIGRPPRVWTPPAQPSPSEAALHAQAASRAEDDSQAEDEKTTRRWLWLSRSFPIAGILVLVASVAAPWRVTPPDAVIVAVTILGLVAYSAGGNLWRWYAQRRSCRVMKRIVRRSNELRLTGQTLSSDEVREAVQDARREMRRGLPWSARYYPPTLSRFIPTWPLPTEAIDRIEREWASESLMQMFSPIQAARFAFWYLSSSIAAFLLVWANQPAACDVGARVCSGAFAGFGVRPLVGSFPYLTFTAVVGNTPADIGARSPTAHLVLVATWLAGLTILSVFGSKLWTRIRVNWEGVPARPRESALPNPREGAPPNMSSYEQQPRASEWLGGGPWGVESGPPPSGRE
jgi:hypothetical protein